MGALTEAEIMACLSENFRLAAEYCEDLARLPKKGPTYIKLRQSLKLLEGACRQAAHWREDARWLKIGMDMAHVHEKAGGWLRGYTDREGRHISIAPGQMNPLFKKLAESLRSSHAGVERLRTMKTNKVGAILPVSARRPVVTSGYKKSQGGILIPSGV